MDLLHVFALVVLLVLIAMIIGIWLFLAIWPGKIATQRNHPRSEAVAMCGYWGALTLGLLMPLAFIWAYADGSKPTDTAEETSK